MSKPDSLRRNIAVNYASQVYVALIGIAMVPLYLKYMGIEAYGLVGFFAMVQAWSQVLDFGLSQTLGREAAKFNAGVTAAGSLNMFLQGSIAAACSVSSVRSAPIPSRRRSPPCDPWRWFRS